LPGPRWALYGDVQVVAGIQPGRVRSRVASGGSRATVELETRDTLGDRQAFQRCFAWLAPGFNPALR